MGFREESYINYEAINTIIMAVKKGYATKRGSNAVILTQSVA